MREVIMREGELAFYIPEENDHYYQRDVKVYEDFEESCNQLIKEVQSAFDFKFDSTMLLSFLEGKQALCNGVRPNSVQGFLQWLNELYIQKQFPENDKMRIDMSKALEIYKVKIPTRIINLVESVILYDKKINLDFFAIMDDEVLFIEDERLLASHGVKFERQEIKVFEALNKVCELLTEQFNEAFDKNWPTIRDLPLYFSYEGELGELKFTPNIRGIAGLSLKH